MNQEKFDKSIYRLNMSFWANVSYELDFQGITRKELSYRVNIKEMTIHKAIERDSIPSADTAVKIAKALNVSLEYLLDLPDDKNTPAQNKYSEQNKMTRLYRKYTPLIVQMEKLNGKEQKAVLRLVDSLAK